MSETKSFPGWKNALEKILGRFKEEGFGISMSHETLLEWMDIDLNFQTQTGEEAKKAQFEYMWSMDRLRRELINEHDLWLENQRSKGYTLLHPNDQVRIPPTKHLQKAKGELNKAQKALSNVQSHMLDAESQSVRVFGLTRVGFLKSAFRKRKTFEVKRKELPNG